MQYFGTLGMGKNSLKSIKYYLKNIRNVSFYLFIHHKWWLKE